MSPASFLATERLTRHFPGVRALEDVSVDFRAGEIHAVCGENGAGKSTMMRLLSGADHATSGQILLDGRPVRFRDPHEAEAAGITMIHQEFNLTPHLTVAENVYAGRLPKRGGIFVDWSRLRRNTNSVLATLGAGFTSSAVVRDLSIPQRQMAEIAKALVRDARVIIMDEPTAALSPLETSALLDIMRGLRKRGVTILFVTHRLREIFAVSDRVTVLRDGHRIATRDVAKTGPDEIVRLMVGRDVAEQRYRGTGRDDSRKEPIFELRSLSAHGRFSDVSLAVIAGEIVGLGGLVGAGRTELARAVVGLDPLDAGEVFVGGHRIVPANPAVALKHGIAYLPEDRKGTGLVLGMNVASNITLASLNRVSAHGFWRKGREIALAQEMIRKLDIRPPDPGRPVKLLSGGNQQKVVIAKWLMAGLRVLIIDEPTRGVDVGAKSEIHAVIRTIADEGIAVVVISSELPELLALSDRILVMRDGELAAELPADRASEEEIIRHATGTIDARALALSAQDGAVEQSI